MKKNGIQSIVEARGVDCLLHFTQFDNLCGIVQRGLMSRNLLRNASFLPSALGRLDENYDAVSVSISRVDSDMFAKKRHLVGPTDWIILGLEAHILWTHYCLFAWRNVATKKIQKHPDRWRSGPWALSKMFEGSNEGRNGLEPWMPTHEDAEVQVLQPIAPHCIVGVIVQRPQMVGPVEAILKGLSGENRPVVINPHHFTR